MEVWFTLKEEGLALQQIGSILDGQEGSVHRQPPYIYSGHNSLSVQLDGVGWSLPQTSLKRSSLNRYRCEGKLFQNKHFNK